MFEFFTSAIKIATNASAGFSLITDAINDLRATIMKIEGKPWSSVIPANASQDNYDKIVFYAIASAIELFPKSMIGLLNTDSEQLKALLEKIGEDRVPQINSEKTYQMGIAILQFSKVLEEQAVNEIVDALVQAGKLDRATLKTKLELLKNRINYYEFIKLCHSYDHHQTNNLLERIRKTNDPDVAMELYREVSSHEQILMANDQAFANFHDFIQAHPSDTLTESAQYFFLSKSKIAKFIQQCKLALSDKNGSLGSMLSKKDIELELESLEKQEVIALELYRKANQDLIQVKQANNSGFEAKPNLPSLLQYSSSQLVEQRQALHNNMVNACSFFENLLIDLAKLSNSPIQLSQATRRDLIYYLSLDENEDIPAPGWKQLRKYLDHFLDEGENYANSLLYQFKYHAYHYISDVESTDIDYLKDIVKDKLSLYRSQLGQMPTTSPLSLLKASEFLKLSHLDQAITYQQKQPLRQAIYSSIMKALFCQLDYELLLQQKYILLLNHNVANKLALETSVRKSIRELDKSKSLSIDDSIGLIDEAIQTYGTIQPIESGHNSSIPILLKSLEEKELDLRKLCKSIQELIQADDTDILHHKYQSQAIEYQTSVQEKADAIKHINTRVQQSLDNKTYSLSIEPFIIECLQAIVNDFEKATLTRTMQIKTKQKLTELITSFTIKFDQLHLKEDNPISDNSNNHETNALALLKQRLDAIQVIPPKQNLSKQTSQIFQNLPVNQRYFGSVEAKYGGIFADYLHQRAAKYAIKDILRNILAVFLGCFGYQTDQSQREQYVAQLSNITQALVANPGDPDCKSHLQAKIQYGLTHFPPRVKPEQPGYELSLHALLTQFEQEIKPLMVNTEIAAAQTLATHA
jgi:hypothetical protein